MNPPYYSNPSSYVTAVHTIHLSALLHLSNTALRSVAAWCTVPVLQLYSMALTMYGCCTLTPPYSMNLTSMHTVLHVIHISSITPHYTPSRTRDRWLHFAQCRLFSLAHYGATLRIHHTIQILTFAPLLCPTYISSAYYLSPCTSTTSVTLLVVKLQSFKVSVSSVSGEIPPTVSITLSVSNARSYHFLLVDCPILVCSTCPLECSEAPVVCKV